MRLRSTVVTILFVASALPVAARQAAVDPDPGPVAVAPVEPECERNLVGN